jgi:hypothetical protein
MTKLLFGPLGPSPLLAWLSILLGLAVISLPGVSLALLASRTTKARFSLYQVPILGLSVSVWYAEVWSLFEKVDGRCVFSLIVISTCASLIAIRFAHASLEAAPLPRRRYLAALLLFSFLVAAIAGTKMNCGDSGIYHLNAIRWIQEWGTPPGIANVHTRLGFNCSMFVAVALLNGILPAAQVTNGIVVLACAIYLLGCIAETRWDIQHRAFLFFASAFGGLILPALSVLSSSPSPDVSQSALAICSLVAGSEFFLLEKRETDLPRSILLLIAIGCLHAKFKASGIILASGIVFCAGLALAFRFEQNWNRIKVVVLGAILFATLLLPWLVRGYITSGYPLFPSTLLGAPVDWKVPESLASNEAAWVYSWARNPGSHWKTVLADNQWLGGWWTRNSTDPKTQGILAFWLISAGLLAGSMAIRSTKDPIKRRFPVWKLLCFLPSLCGVLFWLLTAPDPRFASGLLWSFGLALLLLAAPSNRFGKSRSVTNLILVLIPVSFLTYVELEQISHEKHLFPADYRIIPLKEISSNYGVRILVPQLGDQVGDSPIPATPENRFQPNLEYRGPSPKDGFRIKGGVPLIPQG